MDLSGKVALVTGAGRGIGRAAAEALSRAGATVVVNDLREADAQATADVLRAGGHKAGAIATDVSDQQAVEAMVARVVKEFGRLDIAVSSAVYSDRELFYEANMDGFSRTINVTMWGAFYLLRASARQMIAQGEGGSIVLVSSPHAELAVPKSMAYNMAKAAVDHMGRTASLELAEHNIRVNLVHPGWTDTPGERKFFSDDELKVAGAALPLGRLAQPAEIARGIAFLCDPASDYITGATFRIDGGVTLVRGRAAPTPQPSEK
ncbi:MAG: SDR family oxidoreductase [Planctomycetes bacterium]|nr:SDR family oxidoreductase [Planctomycetota bacterium]